MTTQTRRLTYEEYLESPEIMARYDIVDGVFIEYPKRTPTFQLLLGQICFLLHKFVSAHKLGDVLLAPLDILIQKEPLRTRQPDVLFVSNERAEILKQGDIVRGGPDLVVEILSLGRNRANIHDKLNDYATVGVRECWLVSPEARTVEVLSLVKARWQRVAIYGLGDIVRSGVLEGLELEVAGIFAE